MGARGHKQGTLDPEEENQKVYCTREIGYSVLCRRVQCGAVPVPVSDWHLLVS